MGARKSLAALQAGDDLKRSDWKMRGGITAGIKDRHSRSPSGLISKLLG